MTKFQPTLLPLLYLGLGLGISPVSAVDTIIPTTSFESQTAFDAYWNYNYPWGTDHNGGARMSPSQVRFDSSSSSNDNDNVNGSQLTITATPVTGQPAASHGGQSIPIHYLSGAVHAKEHFTVSSAAGVSGYDFSAEFKGVTAATVGTWPAFWLTAVDSWPPEIDIAEWKGQGKIHFNTFNTSDQLSWTDVEYDTREDWHSVSCEVRDLGNGRDVGVRFVMDGMERARHVGGGFVGKAMYLIVNLQMEGSSGGPGPAGDTEYIVRNLEVLSYSS